MGDLRGGRRIRKSGEKGACREGEVGKRPGGGERIGIRRPGEKGKGN